MLPNNLPPSARTKSICTVGREQKRGLGSLCAAPRHRAGLLGVQDLCKLCTAPGLDWAGCFHLFPFWAGLLHKAAALPVTQWAPVWGGWAGGIPLSLPKAFDFRDFAVLGRSPCLHRSGLKCIQSAEASAGHFCFPA